jgi:hypothetical protein
MGSDFALGELADTLLQLQLLIIQLEIQANPSGAGAGGDRRDLFLPYLN